MTNAEFAIPNGPFEYSITRAARYRCFDNTKPACCPTETVNLGKVTADSVRRTENSEPFKARGLFKAQAQSADLIKFCSLT